MLKIADLSLGSNVNYGIVSHSFSPPAFCFCSFYIFLNLFEAVWNLGLGKLENPTFFSNIDSKKTSKEKRWSQEKPCQMGLRAKVTRANRLHKYQLTFHKLPTLQGLACFHQLRGTPSLLGKFSVKILSPVTFSIHDWPHCWRIISTCHNRDGFA